MKILYLSVYSDGTGYSQAAITNILALDAAGAEVCCRPIKFNHHQPQLPPRILELQNRSFSSWDVTIQHVPPYAMDYDAGGGLNVGVFYAETRPIPPSWVSRASQMDLLMVPCSSMAEYLKQSPHLRCDIEVVPVPADLEEIAGEHQDVPEVREYQGLTKGKFLFYTIGELGKRKNALGLLRAFHAEFRPWEQVGLVVRGSLSRASDEQLIMHTHQLQSSLRQGMKLYASDDHYLPELFIHRRLSRPEMLGLHRQCDCFVQPSYAESWSIPAFEAMALGKTPIVSASGGYLEYMTDQTGWLIPTRAEPVFGEGEVHAELFSGRHIWDAPDLLALQRAMRQAFEDRDVREEKSAAGKDRARLFSLSCVGTRMLEVLRHGKKRCQPVVRRGSENPSE